MENKVYFIWTFNVEIDHCVIGLSSLDRVFINYLPLCNFPPVLV